MKASFINLNRYYKQVLMVISDQLVLSFALILSFVLRFGDNINEAYTSILTNWWLFIIVPIVTIIFFIKSGLYRAVLKYIGTRLMITTFKV